MARSKIGYQRGFRRTTSETRGATARTARTAPTATADRPPGGRRAGRAPPSSAGSGSGPVETPPEASDVTALVRPPGKSASIWTPVGGPAGAEPAPAGLGGRPVGSEGASVAEAAVEQISDAGVPVAGPYSPVVRAGDWLVTAGQVGIDPDTLQLAAGGAGPEARQALANIRTVLAAAGAGLGDVAKTTVFVADLADFGAINDAYSHAFGDHRPARTTVEVAALPLGAAVEIEAWAYRPGRA